VLVLALAGCGSNAPDRRPTATQMSQLERHLSDARAAQRRHDGPAATAALQALSQDLTVVRRQHRLSDALASTLSVEVAQAQARVRVELPASTGGPASAGATAAPPAATPPAATPPATPPPPPAAARPDDHGKDKGKGKGKGSAPKAGHGGGGGGGDGGD
jgi:hypothetical protein